MASGRPSNQTFKKTLDKSDFELFNGSGNTQSITNGDWNVVGEFSVPPQQAYAYGFGRAEQSANQGYLYIDLQDDATSPANISGKLRLVQEDANGLTKFVVYEEQSSVLRGDKNDRQQKVPLPEQVQYPQVGEDSRMKIEFDPESDTTGSHDNSDCLVPVTVRT